MKLQAKDLKVGQTVKYGNVWVLIKLINKTTFKNGKDKIEVIGTQLEGIIKRSNGIKQRIRSLENYNIDFKVSTKVSIK